MKEKILLFVCLIIIILEGVLIIMPHEKVYVYCENMCKEEGLTKEQIEGKFVVRQYDIPVIVDQGATALKEDVELLFPEGFNKDNCVVVSIGLINNENNVMDMSYGTEGISSDESLTAILIGSIGKSIVFRKNGGMDLRLAYNFGAPVAESKTYYFTVQLVLMKIS